jgi:hypothetical protein
MPNFAVKNTDINDTINYLLAGNTGIGQQVSNYYSRPPTYLTGNTLAPYSIGQYDTGNLFSILTATWLASGVVTLTFATQPTQPYTVGQTIYVDALNPSSSPLSPYPWSGTQTVTACTTSSVTYNIGFGFGTQTYTNPGTVQNGYPNLKNFSGRTLLTNAYVDVSINGADDIVLLNSQCKWGGGYLITDTPTINSLNVVVSIQRQDLSYVSNLIELVQDNNVYPTQTNPPDTGNRDLAPEETVFIGIVDRPPIGVYRYWLTFRWRILSGTVSNVHMNYIYIRNTSINGTVIKK